MTAAVYRESVEFDLSGQPARVHAVAWYGDQPWPATACGLAGQAYVSTGTPWVEVPQAHRCPRCVAALAPVQP